MHGRRGRCGCAVFDANSPRLLRPRSETLATRTHRAPPTHHPRRRPSDTVDENGARPLPSVSRATTQTSSRFQPSTPRTMTTLSTTRRSTSSWPPSPTRCWTRLSVVPQRVCPSARSETTSGRHAPPPRKRSCRVWTGACCAHSRSGRCFPSSRRACCAVCVCVHPPRSHVDGRPNADQSWHMAVWRDRVRPSAR